MKENENYNLNKSYKEIQEIIFNVLLYNINNLINYFNTNIGDICLENSDYLKEFKDNVIKISAKTGEGVEDIYNKIAEMFKTNEIKMNDGIIITNIRHKNQIDKAINSVNEAIDSNESGLPIDIVSIPIKQILNDLSAITGEDVSEDIINEIFSKFCLGK